MPKIPAALDTVDALCAHLALGTKERAFLQRYGHYRYGVAIIAKRRGGHRVLRIPEKRLMFLQRQILPLLEVLYAPRISVHGFVKGRSALTNANAHQARPWVLNIDLEDFFGSISRRRVKGVLTSIGLDAALAELLCTLCVTADQLPQGAPTSPILSNMVCYRMDRELTAFAKTHRLRYTRYADDITFSGYTTPTALFEGALPDSGPIAFGVLSPTLRSIFLSNGFTANEKKLRFSGPRSRKEVTGLVVNEFTNLRRTFIRNVRASLYRIETAGLPAAQADFAARYGTKARLENVLRGQLEWIAQVRGRSFAPYRTLATRFNAQFSNNLLPIDPTLQEIALGAVWVVEYAIDVPGVGLANGQGTAFFLEGIGLVSADHTFADLPAGAEADLYRPIAPALRYKARPSARRDTHRDLVILDHTVPTGSHAVLSRSGATHKLRDEIAALGFPDFSPGDEMVEVPGRLISRPTKHGIRLLEVSAVLSSGLSGGPVINDRYEVLGIVQRGGLEEPKQFAVSVEELDGI